MHRYVYIWEFEVQADHQAEFLRHYGPDGTWDHLFRQASGFLETILLHDQERPGRYLTVDRWDSHEAQEAFLQTHRPEYDRIDRLCESLTTAERSLGAYWEVAPDASAA
jgi:heme-degrading monooxygenase HmoA